MATKVTNDSDKINDNNIDYLRRGIYLLPNLITTIGLFAGFYAIVAAMKGLFSIAAVAIYAATIADGLDGRIARLTHTQSAFGAQYDSLSDMIGFGIAPALVAYSLALRHFGKLGWLIAFWYAVATALRLARFNVQITADNRCFYGLPCPAAAGLIASLVWATHIFHFHNPIIDGLIAIIVATLAALMVSNITYLSFKDLNLKGQVPFFVILIAILVVVAIAWDPPRILLTIALIYVLSGPVMALKQVVTHHC